MNKKIMTKDVENLFKAVLCLKDIKECCAKAKESIESGKALACFKKYVEINS